MAKPVARTKLTVVPKAVPKKTPRRSVLSDEIHDMIKAMIFSHEIAPGQRVNIDALALRLEVSQTPIREALARLESEGLIAKEPLKGFSATPLLSLKQFNDLFQFRLLIEPWAAEAAAKNVDSVGAAALKAEMQSAQTALKFKDVDQVEALTEHDTRFHSLIARMSGNQSLLESFERTHCHLHLFRLFVATKQGLLEPELRSKFVQDLFEQYYQSDSGQIAMKEHAEITKAILAKNSKVAKATMYKHIESSMRRYSPAAQAVHEN